MKGFIAAIIVLLGLAASASAYAPGDDITAQPEVTQALTDATAYWAGRTPAGCPGGVQVLVGDLPSVTEAAEVVGCSITVATAWVSTTPVPDRTRWCALFAHEYGHVLGYGHDHYPEDIDGVMATPVTPQFCLTFNAARVILPKACRWPAWARTTPSIRRLYAAGRKHAALRAFHRWRRRHRRAALPGPCVDVDPSAGA